MNIFKTLSLFLMFGLSTYSLADNISQINQKIDLMERNLSQMDTLEASLSFEEGKKYKDEINQCVRQYSHQISELKKEFSTLKPITSNSLGLEKKQKIMEQLVNINDQNALCLYLQNKIPRLITKIYSQKQENFLKNLYQKNMSFFHLLKESHISFKDIWFDSTLWNHYLKNGDKFLQIKSILIVLLYFLLVIILEKFLPSFKNLNIKFNFKNYLLILPIFWIILPIHYIVLNNIFTNFFDRLLQFSLHLPYFIITCIFLITFLYNRVQITFCKKDIILIGLHLILLLNLGYLTYGFQYLIFNHSSETLTIYFKYMILICLQPLIYLTVYWLYYRTFKGYHHVYRFLCLIPVLVLSLGLYGYLNFAASLSFMLIIISILLLILFYLQKFRLILSNIFSSRKETPIFLRLFGFNEKLALFHFKILIYFIIYLQGNLILLISILPLIFYMTDIGDIYYYVLIYKFSFLPTTIQEILVAFALLVILNIINYFISNQLAKKIIKNPCSVEKAVEIFKVFGYILILLYILHFLGLPLQNLFVLMGGLSIGIGLGLKNVLSDFISSIILMAHRPFDIGDFIQIEQTKGFVKKISLLETYLETLDNNIIILPNQKIAASVVQNFTYANKNYHKIHLSYVLKELNSNSEANIKDALKNFFSQQSGIVSNEQDSIKIIFSLLENTLDNYRLEIIFCIDNTKHIKEPLLKINREIFSILQSFNPDVIFEKLDYPIQS